MYYRRKLDNLNFLIEVVIKHNNKLYKLAIETYYSNFDSKTRV